MGQSTWDVDQTAVRECVRRNERYMDTAGYHTRVPLPEASDVNPQNVSL